MGTERRAKCRYPLELNVRFHTMGTARPTAGFGQTLNMSSSGMFLACSGKIAEGTRLKLFVEWPSLLNGTTPLQLITVGTVVRSSAMGLSVVFESYQFRTMGRKQMSIAIDRSETDPVPHHGGQDSPSLSLIAKSAL